MTAITDIPDRLRTPVPAAARSPIPGSRSIRSRPTDASSSGLRLAKPHTNARGFVHGGLIAALADKAMGHSCGHEMGGASFAGDDQLAIDFIGSAQIGQWLAVESDVIKTGSTICFAQMPDQGR